MIEFKTGGLLTTVQDKGRAGHQRYGVAMAGAMDCFAHSLSNVIVGNDPDEASLEVTALGPTIMFKTANIFAITGAKFPAKLNGIPIENKRAYLAAAGSILEMGTAELGMRAYIAFAGGIEADEIMGSKSTFMKGGIGGIDGRNAKAGDTLRFPAPRTDLPNFRFRQVKEEDFGINYSEHPTLRVLLGPQDDHFSEKGLNTLFSAEYTVTKENDRMGYRLEGPEIEFKEGYSANIISDGIARGAIQVPNGKPIIMMSDRQTTGGYAKIGSVINADLALIAQLKQGDTVRFRPVDIHEAQRLYVERKRMFAELTRHFNEDTIIKKTLSRVNLNGRSFTLTVEEYV